MSHWVGDIGMDTNHSHDQQPASFTQDPGKLDLSHKITLVGKHVDGHTSQDNIKICDAYMCSDYHKPVSISACYRPWT